MYGIIAIHRHDLERVQPDEQIEVLHFEPYQQRLTEHQFRQLRQQLEQDPELAGIEFTLMVAPSWMIRLYQHTLRQSGI